MIDVIEGRLEAVSPTLVHVRTGPFVLEISVPLSSSQHIPTVGASVRLWAHLLWKEDGPVLFGFASRAERELFRLLLRVQGVGPRLALSLLSHLPPRELVLQVRQRSLEGLTRVPGVGAKTAGRILVDLGPRIDRLQLPAEGGMESPVSAPGAEDAVQALTALGYAARDARKAVDGVLHEDPALPLDECVRRSLRRLTRSTSPE